MKIETKVLKDILSRVDHCVMKTDTMPILKNIFINSESVSAYNMKNGCYIETDVFKEDMVVPFNKLRSAVGNSEHTILNVKDGVLEIASGTSKAKIPLEPEDDFPTFFDLIDTIVQSQYEAHSTMLLAMKQCLPFASKVNAESLYCSIHLSGNKVQATDRKTIAEYIIKGISFPAGSFVIPSDFVKMISKIDTYHVSEGKFAVIDDNTIYFTNLIDGTYPDVSQYIPDVKKYIKLPKEELKSGLKRVGDFTEDGSAISLCEVTFDKQIKIEYQGKVAEIQEVLDFGKKLPQIRFEVNPYLFTRLLDYCDMFSFVEGSTDVLFGCSSDLSFKAVLSVEAKK
jgi:DNA polymerase III sliding clamp (beta) subunit (PCNA family)